MTIGIDTSPLNSEHADRGIGSYTRGLVTYLEKVKTQHSFMFSDTINDESEALDIIHYPYYELFSRRPKCVPNVKTIVTLHDLIPVKFSEHFPVGVRGKINWYYQKHILKKVAAIITDSESSKQDIVDLVGIDSSKVHVVYLAASDIYKRVADAKTLSTIANKYSIKKPYILYVGDVNWNKNVPGLLQAFSNVNKKYSNINLMLVGGAFKNDIEQTRQIHKTITDLNLNNRVHITGYVDAEDMSALYSGAEVYVQPSFYEGFGLPLLEAMTCGAIVVSSNEGSLSEIGGKAAIYTDAYSPDEMAKDIMTALNMDNKKKIKLRQHNTEHAKSFSWKQTALNTIKIYKKVIDKK